MNEYITIAAHKEFAARIDDENKRQNKRIDKLEETVERINTLSMNVERLAANMESMAVSTEKMASEMKSQGTRLDAIEKEPGENWKKVTWEIVKYAVILALGIVAVKIGAAV